MKPENIFLDKNITPIVGDFGICFFNENNKRFTITEEAVGPYFYMAPELENGRLEDIIPSSDVYSLGKILYWLISNGKIFSREVHREEEYNLSKLFKDLPEFHLINEYLDKMIVADPSKRFMMLTRYLIRLELLERRINMNAHSIGSDIPQLCSYCGLGYYKKVVEYSEDDDGRVISNFTSVKNFGFKSRSESPIWLILVCEYCGNTQIFRPEYRK